MILDSLDLISIITTFQLLLLGLVLINFNKGNKISNKILSAFMFANAVFIANFFLSRLRIDLYGTFPILYYAGTSFYLLLGPLLYGYTRSLCYRDFRLKSRDLLHLLPYVIVVICLSAHYMLRVTASKSEPLVRITAFDSLFYNISLHLQILCYLAITLTTLRKYRIELKQFYSSVEKINLSWLLYILVGFILMWLMDLATFTLSVTHLAGRIVINILAFISLSINFIFATFIVYKGLRQPALFSGIEEKAKYAKSRLTRDQSERHIKKLVQYMNTEKPYLMPSLSINDLAAELSIPSRYISQGINDSLNQNFFDFVNGYRIEEAKRIFMKPAGRKKTILEVLYEVGFNSKSVFNTAFKKHTGMTPSQFKKQYHSKYDR